MPFRVVSKFSRRMGVLNGSGDRRKVRGSLGVNLGRPIVTDGDGDALFPNCFGGGLVFVVTRKVIGLRRVKLVAATCRLLDESTIGYRSLA